MNQFCRLSDLKNEADVEQIFLRRLIEFIGYKDHQIRPKDSLTELTVGGMRGSGALYRPDFAIKIGEKVRWIVEAKSVTEDLDKHLWQPRGYCTLINGQYHEENPVLYFILSNGIKTRLYRWDVNEPLIELDFDEIQEADQKFKKLLNVLAPNAIAKVNVAAGPRQATFKLTKHPIEDVNTAFAWCHQYIYKKDNISQSAAFTEFTKVIFLKLLSDREIRNKYPSILVEESIEVPVEEVLFSLNWVDAQEKFTPNPLDSIQFHNFINSMEKEIERGERKRIFDKDEHINLFPETIRGVVAKIENIFLFGIDVDLNGRLFETFLNATMRGKDLGQYFTPRSIVYLGTRLAQIRVNAPMPDGSWHTDIVLDACCGTGGFLIEALSAMWGKFDNNPSLGADKKDELKKRIANHHVYGIDVGREPPLARIARLNMYLHGDGGSSIFSIDALDKDLPDFATDSPEVQKEKIQLRKLFNGSKGFADVVLTNPPFAKMYERRGSKAKEDDQKIDQEARILDGYSIGKKPGGSKRPSLKSNLMFIERYHDLLKPGGRLVAVIDDGILNGKSYDWFRTFIRSRFLVKAIISLPGDAFQRSKARVKTSLLIAEKRIPGEHQEQPPVFMYGCQYIGIDDSARQRTLPIDRENKAFAVQEINIVEKEYPNFISGIGDVNYVVNPDKLNDRLDVKSCLMRAGRLVEFWKQHGVEVVHLSALVDIKKFEDDDVIETKASDDFLTYLRVRYDGFAEAGDEIVASETNYSHLYRVHTNDIVISNIAANYGSVAVVPYELDGCVVSSEFTVLTAKNHKDISAIWLLLRSPEIRADMLLRATGISRNRVKWEQLQFLQIPIPSKDNMQRVSDLTKQANEAEKLAIDLRGAARELLEGSLNLDNVDAQHILNAFKPPK